jgi:hypothetical protein
MHPMGEPCGERIGARVGEKLFRDEDMWGCMKDFESWDEKRRRPMRTRIIPYILLIDFVPYLWLSVFYDSV